MEHTEVSDATSINALIYYRNSKKPFQANQHDTVQCPDSAGRTISLSQIKNMYLQDSLV